jgi:hypothetical protein
MRLTLPLPSGERVGVRGIGPQKILDPSKPPHPDRGACHRAGHFGPDPLAIRPLPARGERKIDDRSRGAICIPPRESGEGGPHEVRWEGREQRRIFLQHRCCFASDAPSTMLRMVPLPRFAGEDEFDRSRGAAERLSDGTPLTLNRRRRHSRSQNGVLRTPMRCSMRSCSRPMPVEALASAALARMTEEKNESKNRKQNADRGKSVFCRTIAGPAAPLSGEAHIYRRSTAVLAPRSLSSQGTQPQAMLPGTWRGHVLRIPLSGRYPPRPVPKSSVHHAPRS